MNVPTPTTTADFASVTLIVGLEIHVELATRTKMFSACPSPAHADFDDAPPNSLVDPVVLGLPGALPVMNKDAVEMAMLVGLALNCRVGGLTRWDRKSYFYPDLPKGYQISQYDLPLCGDGAFDLPGLDARGGPDFAAAGRRIGIVRAHLEEDAGKLLHEAPGGGPLGYTIADYNRAGTPLLEIVTAPDFRSAAEVVFFAKALRDLCRFLGVTRGVMQKGHIRFEPNINCHIALKGGQLVKTPIVEIKNLNSFKAVGGAIEFESADQPRRWLEDAREHGPGAKTTRGWDDARGVTVVQREKEDAHDYRYFPDPDLPPVFVDDAWRDAVAARVPELPLALQRELVRDAGLGVKEAAALTDERATWELYRASVDALVELGQHRPRAAKLVANLLLQSGAKLANERGVELHALSIPPAAVAGIAHLRESGRLSNQGADELFADVCTAPLAGENPGSALETRARDRGWLIVRDDAALDRWIDQALAAHPAAAADVKAGKLAAAGRLVGEVMKLAGGATDAKAARAAILAKLGVAG